MMMIKLIVNPEKNPVENVFNKSTIIIGSGFPTEADLYLPEETLQPNHVQIQNQEDRYVITNSANDPFVSLNGIPFGKRVLKNNDLLQIGHTMIRIVIESSPESTQEENLLTARVFPKEPLGNADERLDKIVHKILESKQNKSLRSNASTPITGPSTDESSTEGVAEENFEAHDQDLQALLEQVEQLESLGQKAEEYKPTQESMDLSTVDESIIEPVSSESASTAPSPAASLKDEDATESEEEGKAWNQKKLQDQPTPKETRWNWKLISFVIVVLFAIILIGASFFYSQMLAENVKEEIKAAEAVADVAMSLAFAQTNHIKPPNQNWSDPDFLKTNLMAILPPEHIPLPYLDNQGQLSHVSYLLRIYTSSDLSQFLVIAQPAPSLLQWLIPKASVLAYSKGMELRKTTDLKSLNRLLLSPTTLDGMSAIEVNYLIKQGEIIPLNILGPKNDNQEFLPPKALALIRPEAENLIYNAPKYYHFSEVFLKKAQVLADLDIDSFELALLQQEMDELNKYPHLVFYTAQGMQRARQSQTFIETLLPNHKFLVGYLKLNPTGKIISSHLLIEDNNSKTAPNTLVAETYNPIDEEINNHAPDYLLEDVGESFTLPELDDTVAVVNDAPEEMGPHSPLDQELASITADHKQALLALETELQQLLTSARLQDLIALLERLQKVLLKHEQTYENNPIKLEKTQATAALIKQFHDLLLKYDDLVTNELAFYLNELDLTKP
jgi:hypothetical protein